MTEFQEAFSSCGLRSSALQASYAMAENVFAVTQTSLVGASEVKTLFANGKSFRADNSIVLVGAAEPDAMRFTSSGEALPDTQVRIFSEAGELLPESQVGEIAILSRTLFSGYFNRPDLTNAALRDGWYFTGDLGFLLAGELYVVGRKKDLLIVGGENIYPQDIEEIVGSHPAIHDGRVIAFGLFNPELGTEDIVIVAEMKDESSTQDTSQVEKQVRESVVANLGFAPKQIFFKPPRWIVKSTAGKPARSTTREKLLKEHPGLNPEVC
jgi:acyl-CoA synthetase (AMP-forming)/AMP-acid ligase II